MPYQKEPKVIEQAETAVQDREADPTVSAVLTVLRISRALERIDAGISPQQYRILNLIGEGGEIRSTVSTALTVASASRSCTAVSACSITFGSFGTASL
jgi:hypothetical protein